MMMFKRSVKKKTFAFSADPKFHFPNRLGMTSNLECPFRDISEEYSKKLRICPDLPMDFDSDVWRINAASCSGLYPTLDKLQICPARSDPIEKNKDTELQPERLNDSDFNMTIIVYRARLCVSDWHLRLTMGGLPDAVTSSICNQPNMNFQALQSFLISFANKLNGRRKLVV